jgi:hypothetical protein
MVLICVLNVNKQFSCVNWHGHVADHDTGQVWTPMQVKHSIRTIQNKLQWMFRTGCWFLLCHGPLYEQTDAKLRYLNELSQGRTWQTNINSLLL